MKMLSCQCGNSHYEDKMIPWLLYQKSLYLLPSLLPSTNPIMQHYLNSSPPSAVYMHQWFRSLLVQTMACHLFGANAGLMPIEPLGTNFSEIWIEIQNFSFMKMHLEILSGKWQPFCPGGDELTINIIGSYVMVTCHHPVCCHLM